MSCHKSTVFTCAVASAFLLILVPSIHGTPTGAPAAACKDMTPLHGYPPQTSASPFKTEIPVGVSTQYTLVMDLSLMNDTIFIIALKCIVVRVDGRPREAGTTILICWGYFQRYIIQQRNAPHVNFTIAKCERVPSLIK
jgi:hypothetical protein